MVNGHEKGSVEIHPSTLIPMFALLALRRTGSVVSGQVTAWLRSPLGRPRPPPTVGLAVEGPERRKKPVSVMASLPSPLLARPLVRRYVTTPRPRHLEAPAVGAPHLLTRALPGKAGSPVENTTKMAAQVAADGLPSFTTPPAAFGARPMDEITQLAIAMPLP